MKDVAAAPPPDVARGKEQSESTSTQEERVDIPRTVATTAEDHPTGRAVETPTQDGQRAEGQQITAGTGMPPAVDTDTAARMIGALAGTRLVLHFTDSSVRTGFEQLFAERGGEYLTHTALEHIDNYALNGRVLVFEANELKQPVLLSRDLVEQVLAEIATKAGSERLESLAEVTVSMTTAGEITGVTVKRLGLEGVNAG